MPTRPSWRKALGLSDERVANAGSIEDFVVITGFSGAGKSQAMACFEDAGYFCVDNLPPEMILSLADLFAHEGSKVERAAVVSDVRGGDYFEGFVKMLDDLEERGTEYRLLFLDASEEELVNRYKETRRRHPLAPGGNVGEGIRVERALLEPLRERADVRIDTTDMSASRLRRVVADKMLEPESVGKLSITFLTYGFKHGAPREADLSFDVRFLPNPHYESELRELTGLDRQVVDYVNGSDGVDEFYERLLPLLDYLLPAYLREGKSHLTIGIGCTGGRHRSVVIAEHLASVYGGRDEYMVDVVHRDVEKPPRRP
jgi:RNase adapter protein RapZ